MRILCEREVNSELKLSTACILYAFLTLMFECFELFFTKKDCGEINLIIMESFMCYKVNAS